MQQLQQKTGFNDASWHRSAAKTELIWPEILHFLEFLLCTSWWSLKRSQTVPLFIFNNLPKKFQLRHFNKKYAGLYPWKTTLNHTRPIKRKTVPTLLLPIFIYFVLWSTSLRLMKPRKRKLASKLRIFILPVCKNFIAVGKEFMKFHTPVIKVFQLSKKI